MREAFFVWEMTAKGRYAPSLYFDNPPGEMYGHKSRSEEFRPIVHPVTDPAVLATVNANDGCGAWQALAALYPCPVIVPEPVQTKVEVEYVYR